MDAMTDETPDAPLDLETGWLPTTPEDDTYLRRFLLNWAGFCADSAKRMGGQSARLDTMHLADSGRPAAFANCATLMQPLAAESVRATLAEIEAFFADNLHGSATMPFRALLQAFADDRSIPL